MFRIGESIGDPEVIEEITATLQAAGDAVGVSADGVLAMFQQADTTTLFDFLAPALIGLDDLRETAEGLTEATSASFRYPVVSVIQLSDTTAISLALSETDIRFEDAPPMTVNTRVTDVWQRIDGRWLAVHEHASVPIDLASGKAVLDAPVHP